MAKESVPDGLWIGIDPLLPPEPAVQQAAPDLVGRNFAAAEPDRLWVADITYVRAGEGFLYLAFIPDVCNRKVVGWSMDTHLRTELVAPVRRPNQAMS